MNSIKLYPSNFYRVKKKKNADEEQNADGTKISPRY